MKKHFVRIVEDAARRNPATVSGPRSAEDVAKALDTIRDYIDPHKLTLKEVKEAIIADAIHQSGNIKLACERLDVARAHIYRKIERLRDIFENSAKAKYFDGPCVAAIRTLSTAIMNGQITLKAIDNKMVMDVMIENGNRIAYAAVTIGVSKNTLTRKMATVTTETPPSLH